MLIAHYKDLQALVRGKAHRHIARMQLRQISVGLACLGVIDTWKRQENA
jgi:hypothetical protein